MRNEPEYLKDNPSKRGRKKEKKVRQTIDSGRIWFDPADLQVTETDEEYLVDVKDIKKQKTFTLNKDKIDRFYKESIPKTPIYLICIGDYVVKASIQRV